MRERIDCYLAGTDVESQEQFKVCRLVNSVHAFGEGVSPTVMSSTALKNVDDTATAEYVLLSLKNTPIQLGPSALERFVIAASDTGAAMVYADYWQMKDGDRQPHPVIDYQEGALRDDFDFGSIILIRADMLHEYFSQQTDVSWKWGGLYDLRLFLSRKGMLFHMNEFLYTEVETDHRSSGEKQFDYVNPRNREVQIEMEQVVTEHLKAVGAYIDVTGYKVPNFNNDDFECEASVVIPVRNRERTIRDAVMSALGQKSDFRYNVIVVDNFSTDATTDILKEIASKNDNLVHIVPERTDLGIGGCWNRAINDERCGRFAVQLDSDDLYSTEDTLQKIVDAFHEQKAAMIIGSYRMCDFDLNTLPPGIIDHREWTDSNGPNNALRINGLGAPRAFYTPLARRIQFPNTSYGEDYAMGLVFSRNYRIGRIYDELYLCRRWGGNSDAALSQDKINANNLYKDRLRTIELMGRKQKVQSLSRRALPLDPELQSFFDDQLESWKEARNNYKRLKEVRQRSIAIDENTVTLQFNPARIRSTAASVDQKSIAARKCFLCSTNRPQEQMSKPNGDKLELLVNPYPILPQHFTLPALDHQPQRIKENALELYKTLAAYPSCIVFYNGPQSGASAPDHLHLQAGTSGLVPLQNDWKRLSSTMKLLKSPNKGTANDGIYVITDYICPVYAILSSDEDTFEQLFRVVYDALPLSEEDPEPQMNLLSWKEDDTTICIVIPRSCHRPNCYYAEGKEHHMISPGALDMAGLIITPREEDFNSLTAIDCLTAIQECGLSHTKSNVVCSKIVATNLRSLNNLSKVFRKEPRVNVGILKATTLDITFNKPYSVNGIQTVGCHRIDYADGSIIWDNQQYKELCFLPVDTDASFSIENVTIGVDFHWERKQRQTFNGNLRLIINDGTIQVINEIDVERYLMSVISSEMSALAGPELLKAHAVISRSWLLAQIYKRSELQKEKTTEYNSFLKTDSEIIRWYDREDHTLFDVCADDHCQRYQGITNQSNRNVVNAVELTRGQVLDYDGEICDARFSKCCGGKTEEYQYCWENIRKPYLRSVVDPYCNTNDPTILRQVLNDYDQETPDFYEWQKEYSQQEIHDLITSKLGEDLGAITDLVAIERGPSGRISKLRIEGTKKQMTIGKELEIRRLLSDTHLYSSNFSVQRHGVGAENVPATFTLWGKGWGHGVGLCQIGAAVMGVKGFRYTDILQHYYRDSQISTLYK